MLLSFSLELSAQNVVLKSAQDLPKLKYKNQLNSTEDIKQLQESIVFQLHEKGYVTAGIDSSIVSKDKVALYIYLGERFKWISLHPKDIANGALNYSGFKEKIYRNKALKPSEHARVMHRISRYYENHGHPFARVFLDSIKVEKNTLKGLLKVDANRLIKIDSIVIKSEEDINKNLIENILGFRQGGVYNEKEIRAITNRIATSNLYVETSPWQIIFSKEKTKLYLFLKSTKSSQFNGIAGVQPDPLTNKVTVTGDITLQLKNALKRAEYLGLYWKKFGEISQELTAQVAYPFLFDSQFGTDLLLHIYKRDSSFVEIEQKAEIQYLFSTTNMFRAFTKRYNSNTLTKDFNEDLSNVSVIYYGLGLAQERLNYRFNPLRGYFLDITSSVGNKKTAVRGINEEIIETQSLQGLIEGVVGGYIPIAKKATIKLVNSTRYIVNDSIYENELFRFGGLKTMRGFDEESLAASFYNISTIELRYLFEQNSNAYLFAEGGFFERRTIKQYENNYPIALGIGLNFQTGAGIFNINYAVGKFEDTPFQLRSAKIHFEGIKMKSFKTILFSIVIFLLFFNGEEKQNTAQLVSDYVSIKYPNEDFSSLIYVGIKRQKLYVIKNGELIKAFLVSTAKNGAGCEKDSEKTPIGLHEIRHKYGDDVPVGGIFEHRKYTGEIAEINQSKVPLNEDYVLTRIISLKGLEDNLNKGENIDSYERAIYIHGTADEGLIGQPASHGCIRMKNKDVIELYELVGEKTKVVLLDN